MKHLFSFLISALLLASLLAVFSCQDDFTEEDLIQQQNKAKLDELKSISAKDSLEFLLKMKELDYERFLDSLARADSIALAKGLSVFLPYTYEVQIYNGSVTSIANNGKVKETTSFDQDVTVTITQYGVKQTATARDGLFTFKNIGVGVIHGKVTGAGFTTFEWTVDVSLPFNFFKAAVGVITGTSGTTYFTNGYYLDLLLRYFNQRSFGNQFPIFATAGPTTATHFGRAFIETNLTNRVKEVVPTGTQISAFLNVNDVTFQERYVIPVVTNEPVPSTDPGLQSVNNIFRPKRIAYSFIGSAATDVNGDYSLTTPASPQGLPILLEYGDVVTNKTFFIETNGDVTQVARRNAYGQSISALYTPIPNIASAPTVGFFAGGGATATAVVSGDGAITDIDLTNGGANYQGNPRVIIGAPPAGGTRATATATVTGGVVTDILVTAAGSGYTSAPTVTITEGGGAVASSSGFQFNTTSGGVDNVQITNPGGVNAAPSVVFYADFDSDNSYDVGEEMTVANFPNGINQGSFRSIGANFPTATANLNGSGVGVSSLSITNAGGGLNFAPRVLITSGILANISVTVAGGVVTSVTITNGGRFYSSPPRIDLDAAAGTGTTRAVLTPTLTNGVITSVAITTAGAGYANGTYVLNSALTIVPNGGSSQATGDVIWRGLSLATINVTNAGTVQSDGNYYSNAPRVIVAEPDFRGNGSRRATASAVLGSDGRVIGINVTDEGAGYYSLPTVTLVSGSGATGIAKFGNRFVSEISVTSGGNGYLAAPSVLVVDPAGNGSGATAVAKVVEGVITSIEVTNGGTGYAAAPTVIILDPGTSYNAQTFTRYNNPALGIVLVDAGRVASIEIYQGGDNYPAGTVLRLNATKGSGFVGTATITSGRISAAAVTTGGAGYVGNNYARQLGANVNPNADVTGIPLPGTISFTGVSSLTARSGVRKLVDIDYGTGQNRD